MLNIKSSTYNNDLNLYHQLGLKPFKDQPTGKMILLGSYSNEYGQVKVWVTPMPAQFWQFEVSVTEAKSKYLISTGSGALTDFWPSIEKILNNMISIENIERI